MILAEIELYTVDTFGCFSYTLQWNYENVRKPSQWYG